ncbi:MAG: hypothetical protein ACK5M3_07455 [Dysgonomonas sp.]
MKKYILFITSAMLLVSTLQAQVTVGSENKPASFSVLQLDGVLGGLRLSHVSENNRDVIDVSSPLAKGLMIYNTDTDWVDYWDGTKWSPVSEALVVRNGLRFDNAKVKLGGSLMKNTTVNLNGKGLNFVAATSTFRVNTDVFQIKGNNITLQPTKFSVNTSVFSVTGNSIALLPYNTGAGKLIMNTGAEKLTVDNRNVALDGKLTYVDGKESNGQVLVASATGDGYWAKLRPNTSVAAGTITSSSTTITGSSAPASPTIVNITSSTLDLTPGKWIIFVNYATTATTYSDRRYIWTYLYSKPTVGGTEALVTQIGSPTSINETNQPALCKLIYLVEVTENTSYTVKCGTRNRYTTASSSTAISAYGTPTFYAMSIIKAGE